MPSHENLESVCLGEEKRERESVTQRMRVGGWEECNSAESKTSTNQFLCALGQAQAGISVYGEQPSG